MKRRQAGTNSYFYFWRNIHMLTTSLWRERVFYRSRRQKLPMNTLGGRQSLLKFIEPSRNFLLEIAFNASVNYVFKQRRKSSNTNSSINRLGVLSTSKRDAKGIHTKKETNPQ